MQRIIMHIIVVILGCAMVQCSAGPSDRALSQEKTSMKHTGGCFCGHVRYEITSEPLNMTVCHCPGCKRSSGAGALPWITVKTSDFRLTHGRLAETRSDQFPTTSCDGCGGTRTFCPNCGTPISYLGDGGRAEREIDVTLGSLDDPRAFTPKEDVFAEHRLGWVSPVQ